ncbi:3-oxoacyl-[acyl-carrier protein] reductase [Verrucomicrobium sp. GAS474]|uniref:SDR family NAD(P)-dependent oxidoreductase n=1 Tax=Verrucomicrobium sp. GAS474 TaxID=1882831 RepID=UPI00087C84AC|nr:SDR family oxidoreductase [Verrucomicrobium sp. GAS474]SDT98116.1 3-oxoacyl-[acyl-carrier protein] reductase [Verrucomicrobium sp. GAS474]
MAPAQQTVLITGGKGDLARAVADAFAAAGWCVLAPGRDALDVADAASVERYFSTLPALDLLVANAGIADNKRLEHLDSALWDALLGTNLRGVFLPLRAALPLLKASAGAAILVGSRVGRRGGHGQAAYAASKAGLLALAQSAAKEHGADGIRINTVLPGFLETKMTASVKPERRAAILAQQALGRFNTPEEAARFLLFLATLPHTSGQVFQLDSRIDPWT